jgi:hypothetical protein
MVMAIAVSHRSAAIYPVATAGVAHKRDDSALGPGPLTARLGQMTLLGRGGPDSHSRDHGCLAQEGEDVV